ncbi:MAG: hypothetical protein EOS81_07160 [Mesorhizobium sp.]|uniref:hypothetical protein n=2 Tax=Mesorhizobium TaxID=68287 RepID=UPI000F756BC4|nr:MULTISPECIES: hypothetical protein [unclassified Mesorhizobium]RVC65848.1 hypothetical protein EN766_33925 [Mesorhizobium sp. M2A.F.Ca.ET.046.02.1.1]RVC66539.1 hypothetical protein EN759_18510 [Mesorhizobium sp. M00.F.Ca.ET.038.03.1.1]AZO38795.1 hypothetical protein EJ072_33315 [Mesorhizobium sp. M2A.F.Ca.ET.046.03.2.1]RWB43574.1 MAG: hypothetical protein EOQ44_18075 [Mesorhizobium sp.]RWE20395.1 MAG: hypothetical protein EOS76_08195 [Mesorhizobium sp.]
MLAKDALIVWTPNSDLYEGQANRGKVVVTTMPEAPASAAHPMSAGRSDHDWNEADNAGRYNLLQQYFSSMIHDDGIDEHVARQALSVIEDINTATLSAEILPDHSGND